MTDNPTTLNERRFPITRDRLKQAGAVLPVLRPALRYVPKNPVLLIGAAVLGVAGVMAWRNREKIVRSTSPMIEEAKVKGQALIDEARTQGEALIDNAKATTEAVAAKATRSRRKAVPPPPEVH
ncbi:hypothetical protein [Phenylobacterium kunshanense]|uniref:Uncharacterized protein n=1 Tax=Phenylobacterium kunshanense TaxID=1445034 RepID=A0A328B8C5_9CAUL|nr:hypothetical protein [Phenylobacterium kunshanense]RAK63612.1 hypothetical protein DJ019_15235 [Phenylobacterium kunshanense]